MPSRHFFHYAVAVNSADKPQVLVPKRGQQRSYLLIENRSAAAIYVNFDVMANSNDGVLIPVNGVWELDNMVPDNQVHISGSTLTDQRVNITEAY